MVLVTWACLWARHSQHEAPEMLERPFNDGHCNTNDLLTKSGGNNLGNGRVEGNQGLPAKLPSIMTAHGANHVNRATTN